MTLEAEIIVDIPYVRWRKILPEAEALVTKTVLISLKKLGVSGSVELGVRLTSCDEIAELNHKYRGQNRPTNVLSFPQDTETFISIDVCRPLGDVVVGFEIIEQEAMEQNKSFAAHLAHMIVHGVLHLMGHEHENENDAIAMEGEEKDILISMGFTDPTVQENVSK